MVSIRSIANCQAATPPASSHLASLGDALADIGRFVGRFLLSPDRMHHNARQTVSDVIGS
jgi:hypothetical protein